MSNIGCDKSPCRYCCIQQPGYYYCGTESVCGKDAVVVRILVSVFSGLALLALLVLLWWKFCRRRLEVEPPAAKAEQLALAQQQQLAMQGGRPSVILDPNMRTYRVVDPSYNALPSARGLIGQRMVTTTTYN